MWPVRWKRSWENTEAGWSLRRGYWIWQIFSKNALKKIEKKMQTSENGWCFGMRWALSSIDWVKWIAFPMSTGIIQSLEGLHRTKRGREEDLSLSLSLLDYVSQDIGCLLLLVQKQECMSTIAHTFMHSAPQELFLLSPLPSSFSIGPKQWENKHFRKKINLQISLSFIQNFYEALNVWQSFFLWWTWAI